MPFGWASDYEVAVVYITSMWSEIADVPAQSSSDRSMIARLGFLSYCVRFKSELAAWSESVSIIYYALRFIHAIVFTGPAVSPRIPIEDTGANGTSLSRPQTHYFLQLSLETKSPVYGHTQSKSGTTWLQCAVGIQLLIPYRSTARRLSRNRNRMSW